MDLSYLQADATQEERRKRRSRRRRAMQDCIAEEIPLDLLIEILTRLPAKSVTRFKCLSKFWSLNFYSRYFCNRFLMLPSPPQPRLYMSLLDIYDYSKALLLSSAPTTCPSSLEFDQNLTISEMGGYNMRVLRGFLCFTVFYKARIYNPTTRQLVIIPVIESDIIAEEDVYGITYFMCHDPTNDQYKLVGTITVISEEMQKIRSERLVFVLEAGGSWKRVAKEFYPHLPLPLEVTMNGVLYYLAVIDFHTSFYFLCYDLETYNLEKVEIKGIPDHWFSKLGTTIWLDIKFMDPSESILYLET